MSGFAEPPPAKLKCDHCGSEFLWSTSRGPACGRSACVKLNKALDERDRAMQAAVLLRRWLRRLVGGGGDFAKAQAEEAMKSCDFLDDWLDGITRTHEHS